MINIEVFSNSNVQIETEEFQINTQDDMIKLIKTILDKAYYSGEKLYLGKATINQKEGKVYYDEIDRWS